MITKIGAALAIGIVALFFAIIAIATFFTRGKIEFLVDTKIKLGAKILALVSLLGFSSCGHERPTCYDTPYEKPNDEPQLLCYDVAYEPFKFIIKKVENDNSLTIFGNKIGAEVDFTYTICIQNDTIAKGDLKTDQEGNFKITTTKAKTGDYKIIFSEKESGWLANEVQFTIKEDENQ